MLAILRDREDGTFVVTFHEDDGLPAYSRHVFDSLEQALEFFSLDWQEPDEDADGDVLKVATPQRA